MKGYANYNFGVSGVTATDPSYLPTPAVNANALGFAYNAQAVLNAIQKTIADYKSSKNTAVVQADVVAHSMGGDIARTISTLSTFAGSGSYGVGAVHKLITIGTPHIGSPLANDLLPSNGVDPNPCVRNLLAAGHLASFQTVTFGTSTVVQGAIGDLASAPANLPPSNPFPIAYLAASTDGNNLNSVGLTGRGLLIRAECARFFEPLALNLTRDNWNSVFLGAANDGVVPVMSQLRGNASVIGPGGNTFTGVIHTSALNGLGFAVPSELDLESGIPDAVLSLLNEPTSGNDFH